MKIEGVRDLFPKDTVLNERGLKTRDWRCPNPGKFYEPISLSVAPPPK